MEKVVVAKKRLSILKKRRSRSVSPTQSPQIERRTSRRISFSGKHAVREFFIGGENKETIWGASYEESTEHHTVASEQMSRQQQSLHMNRTKNETIRSEEAMECSSIIASTTRLGTSSIAISSTFRRDRTIHGNVSIPDAEKENVFYPSVPKARVDEKPSSDAMNMTVAGPSKPAAKIKLFESMRQKKSMASDTVHQSKDMSLDMYSIASNRQTTFAAQSMSILDDASRSPPTRAPQLNRLNETNVNNADMSVMSAQSRPSVICKSPSKNAANRGHKNHTVNFGSDAMDVTQGVKDHNNLQESRYPLNATVLDQSQMDILPKPEPKPAVVTNPYLKMFLGETSNSSSTEPLEIKAPVAKATSPGDRNGDVTAHEMLEMETSSLALDHSHGAQLFPYPNPIPANPVTLAPTEAKNQTICDQFSIDKSFDFALPEPVTQVQDKENIFVVPSTPAAGDRKAFVTPTTDATARISLSDSINTTVFNFHRDHIVNSTNRSIDSNLETTSQPANESSLAKVSLDMSVAPTMPELPLATAQLPVAMPQLPSRPTIYCNQTIRNETTQVADHDNESIEITNQIPTLMAVPVLNRRRATCFKNESIDESVIAFDNVAQTNENIKISMSPAPASPMSVTILDDKMNISSMPMPSIDHHRNVAHRKTHVFHNEPICTESTSKELPASALDSYHHLTMEQTQIASPATAAIHTSQPSLLPPRLSMECSRPLDEFCQLTFIDDDDIAAENMDLIETIDSTDGNDDDDDCMIVEQTMDMAASRPGSSLNIPPFQSHPSSTSVAFETRLGNSQISLASPLQPSIDEKLAFKKSRILKRSIPSMHDMSMEPSTSAVALNRTDQNRTASKPVPMIMQGNSIDANSTEVSYLHDVTVDKNVKDIKLDFSGYEKFKGLATPADVCNAFVHRCEVFKQKMHYMREAGKTRNTTELQSQNLEAPSLKFLFFNKLAMLDAENAAKFKEECDEKPVGALVPVIPAILMLIKNKCKELKHWRFESLWFYRGRLILRHKIMQSYKFILDFDPEQKAVDDHINLYGKLLFTRARSMQCPFWLPQLRPVDRLRLQAAIANEPINLLQMCPNSNELSSFDEKMHAIVRDAHNKVTDLAMAVIDANAIFKIDTDLVYIHYLFDEREHLRFVTCNIKLTDIDRTGPECVQTIPFRALHNDVNALPKGIDFIREFLRNSRKYLTQQSEAN